MKKFYYSLFTAATLLLSVTSCSQEEDFVQSSNDVTTFSISLNDATQSRAVGEGSEVDKLYYAVYQDDEKVYPKSGNGEAAIVDKKVKFDLPLLKGEEYDIIFWAQKSGNEVYNIDNLSKIKVNYNVAKSNQDSYDAFYNALDNFEADGKEHTVKLRRPFAQLNLGTSDWEQANSALKNNSDEAVTHSSVEITGLADTFEPLVGKAYYYNEPVTATFGAAAISKENFTVTVNGTTKKYTNLSFNYLLVPCEQEPNGVGDYQAILPSAEKALVNVTYTLYRGEGEELFAMGPISNVPVQRNYRTNIVGELLTGTNFDIEIKPEYNEPSLEADKLYLAAAVGGEVTLTEDVVLTSPLNVTADMIINLNGKTISGNWAKAEGAIIKNAASGTLTIQNGTISSTGENGGSAVQNNGTMVVEGVTLNGAPNANGSWPSYTVNNTGNLTINNSKITSYHGAVASYGDNAVVTLNNSEIDMAGIPGFTSHGIYTYNNGKVIVNGGTYENKATDQNSSGASVINGAVEVNAGTFSGRIENYYGTPVLKGGTYNVNPSNYVAEAYKVIEKDDKYVVVAKEVNNVVKDKAELKSALEAAKNNNETNVVIDAAGANIGDLNYGLTQAMVPAGTTVTIRNANVEGKSYGNGVNGTVIFEDCTFNNSGAYSIHFDNGNGNVIFKNCDLYGWNSFGSSLTSVAFENCTLTGNGTYALIRSYVNLTLTNCVINTSNANQDDDYSEGVEAIAPATLTENNVTYVVSNPKELKAAIIKGGKIEFANDITVDEWIMFSEDFNIGDGTIITVKDINVSIDGKGHTLTVNAIESAGNNDQLFQGADVLNISNLTIKYADGLTTGGLGMDSGVIKNVHFVGGGSAASSAAIFPHNGVIKVEDCIFDTNGVAFYFEHECDNLTVTGCTFNQKAEKNVILLRGDVKFTNNIINSGRTVNVVSGSPVVTGNDFKNVRFKVYGAATATISNNTINNLEFDGTTYSSTFSNNTLSDAAQAALDGATKQ